MSRTFVLVPLLDKLSPLTQERIDSIVGSCASYPGISTIALRASRQLSNPLYAKLFDDFRSDSFSNSFLRRNFLNLANFLKDAGAIAYDGDDYITSSDSAYPISAAGVKIVMAYHKTKPINRFSHEIEVVRNTNIRSAKGSNKVADVFYEKKGIHDALHDVVVSDLKDVDGDFNKSYIVEAFGTRGGNHFFAITIRKKDRDNAPIVELFDSSPCLIRGGLAEHQNQIANGWDSMIRANATINAAFKKCGLEFRQENFFHNMEPMQAAGGVNCSTFCCEKALITARMSYEEHQDLLLKHFIFPSPYGGMAELPVDIEEVKESGGFLLNPKLNLPIQYMVFTHFVNSSLLKKGREAELADISHRKKDGEDESSLELLHRYLEMVGHDASGSDIFINRLITQKVLRQKYCHLFEIITNPSFLALARDSDEISDDEYYGMSYIPPIDVEREYESLIWDINRALPVSSKVNSFVAEDRDGKQIGKVAIYMGELSANHLNKWMQEKFADISDFNCRVCLEPFDFDVIGKIPQDLFQRAKIIIELPLRRDVLNRVKEAFYEDIFIKKIHDFSTPSTNTKVKESVEPLLEQASHAPD